MSVFGKFDKDKKFGNVRGQANTSPRKRNNGLVPKFESREDIKNYLSNSLGLTFDDAAGCPEVGPGIPPPVEPLGRRLRDPRPRGTCVGLYYYSFMLEYNTSPLLSLQMALPLGQHFGPWTATEGSVIMTCACMYQSELVNLGAAPLGSSDFLPDFGGMEDGESRVISGWIFYIEEICDTEECCECDGFGKYDLDSMMDFKGSENEDGVRLKREMENTIMNQIRQTPACCKPYSV